MPMTQAQLESLVKRVELFHGLTPEEVEKILGKGLTQLIRKDEVVFYAGTVGSTMYVVLGGKVGVFGDDNRCITTLTTGDMFGEMALVTHEKRSATVKAIEDGYLFVLNEETFKRLLDKKVAVHLLFNMVHTLSHRLKLANERITELQLELNAR